MCYTNHVVYIVSHIVNVHREINMSKENVYHGTQNDVQSVLSLYKVTEWDKKLNPGWKVLMGSWCTIPMLLKCFNVVLSSRRKNKDHPIGYEITVPRVIPVRNNILCEHGAHQFNLGESNKRLTVCTYQRRVLIDVREFIEDQSSKEFSSRPENTLH